MQRFDAQCRVILVDLGLWAGHIWGSWGPCHFTWMTAIGSHQGIIANLDHREQPLDLRSGFELVSFGNAAVLRASMVRQTALLRSGIRSA